MLKNLSFTDELSLIRIGLVHNEYDHVVNRTSTRLAVFLLAVAAYTAVIPLPFMIDDRFLIPTPSVPSPWSWAFLHQCLIGGLYTHGGGTAYVRPLFSLYIGVMAWLFGLNPMGYHIASLAIHGLNAILVFELFQGMRVRSQASFIAAALFAVHPAIVGEMMPAAASGMLALLFSLGSLCALNRPSRRDYIIGLVLFAAALLVKESNAMIPCLYALMLYAQHRLRRDGKRIVPLLLGLGIYAIYRASILPPEMHSVRPLAHFYLHALPLITGQLAGIAIVPWNLMSWRALPPPTSLWPLYWGVGIAVFIIAHRRNARWIVFAGGWFIISVAPFLMAVTLHGSVMDQWIYPGLVGLLLPVGLGLDRVMQSRTVPVARAAKGVFAALLLSGIALVFLNVNRRGSDVKNFRWTFEHFPAADFAKQRFLAALIQEGHWRQAELYRDRFHNEDPSNPAYQPHP